MFILDTTPCTASNILYTKSGTFDFLQLAHKNTTSDVLITQIGSSYSASIVYVLYGCDNTVGGGNNNISAGAVFFGGEIYHHNGSVFAVSGGSDVIVANLQITQYTTNADPTDFSDTVARNVHNQRFVTFANAPTNTGTLSGDHYSNFSELVKFYPDWTNVATSGGWVIGGSLFGRYRKPAPYTKVEMRGIIVASVLPTTLTIGTLPVGYRPSEVVYVSTPCYRDATNTFDVITLKIETTGVIAIYNAGDTAVSSGDFISLEGISFYVV